MDPSSAEQNGRPESIREKEGADEDRRLLTRYREGDVAALERLVEKYRPMLYGYIVNTTEGRDDTDEIFQEVWFRVIRKQADFQHGNFGGWLVRIARNLVIDRARGRRNVVSLDAPGTDGRSIEEKLPGEVKTARANLADEELGRRIREAVEELPMEQKEVFWMRMQAGLPFREIADIQGVSINTALARMQYALAKLRDRLKDAYRQLGET